MKTASKTRTVLQGGALIWLLIFIPFIQAQTAAPTWTQLSPASAPVGREGHSAVYDGATNRMIVFGGRGASGTLPNEVWVLSNADGAGGPSSWTLIASGGPSARSFHTAVYDSANNKMIVFGGEPLTNDVWVLSFANGQGGTPTWTLLTPAAGPLPSPRQGHSAVYDAASNRMIIFGGENSLSVTLDEVWVLSHANGLGGTPTWMLLSPIGATMSREFHSAVYDPASNRMIVFGGVVNFALANDVRVLSNANGLGTPAWTVLSPTGAIGARDMHSAVYDAANNRMTVFGGIVNFVTANDLWTLSNANGLGGAPAWTQLTPIPGPGVRRAHSAVYHSANNRMIVFGGFTGSGVIWANDTWVLSNGGPDPDVTVQILIEPGEDPRPPTLEIEPGALFDVAILSSSTFNALTMVDRTSLTFGRTGHEASIAYCYDADKEGEGVGMHALICRFSIQQAGFHPGDTLGVMMGRTVTGAPFTATDSIRIAVGDNDTNSKNDDQSNNRDDNR